MDDANEFPKRIRLNWAERERVGSHCRHCAQIKHGTFDLLFCVRVCVCATWILVATFCDALCHDEPIFSWHFYSCTMVYIFFFSLRASSLFETKLIQLAFFCFRVLYFFLVSRQKSFQTSRHLSNRWAIVESFYWNFIHYSHVNHCCFFFFSRVHSLNETGNKRTSLFNHIPSVRSVKIQESSIFCCFFFCSFFFTIVVVDDDSKISNESNGFERIRCALYVCICARS